MFLFSISIVTHFHNKFDIQTTHLIQEIAFNMTEQLKFIINQLNNEVHTNYDLIKFDSLNEAQHLQILVDLLVHYEAGEKVIDF